MALFTYAKEQRRDDPQKRKSQVAARLPCSQPAGKGREWLHMPNVI
jgi:hypothetical protein